jgi:hypothetical protein
MTRVFMHDRPTPIVDDDDVLADGGAVRVPMMLRDAADEVSLEQIAKAKKRSKRKRDEDDDVEEDCKETMKKDGSMIIVDAFGRSDQLSLSQPGYRTLAPAAANTAAHAVAVTSDKMKADAYADAKRANSEAWQTRRTSDASEFSGRTGSYDPFVGYGAGDIREREEWIARTSNAWKRRK